MDRPRSGPAPVERSSGEPSNDPEWRADALAQSRHSRLDEELVEPLDDHDPERAIAVCAEITRRALRDFAPGLVLLSPAERRRVQALSAFGLTLFDFARQSSLEGEKLAQINRWCFDLESTLAGSPPGQPVFVLLAAAHAEEPWPEEALQRLAGCARQRAVRARPASVSDAAREALRLAGALATALVPAAGPAFGESLAALLRLGRLLDLGEDRRRHQAGLATTELPEDWSGAPTSRRQLAGAVRRECARLGPILGSAPGGGRLSPTWTRAVGYAVLAGRRLLRRCDAGAERILDAPPRLGAGERILLLVRCRWLGL